MARRPSDVQYLGCHVIKRGCGGGETPPRRREIGETAQRNRENFPLTRPDKVYKRQQELLAAAKARPMEEARRNKEKSMKAKAANVAAKAASAAWHEARNKEGV